MEVSLTSNQILVLFAHPAIHRSIVNRRFIKIYDEFENITFRDLYDIYPEFMIDIEQEQALLRQHEVIIFHHPMHWYSAPPILKQWQDLVLRNGFAYGEGGDALKGKKMLCVISTGQSKCGFSASGIHQFEMRQFLIPFEQTANFCGMEFLPPFVAHGPLRHVNRQNIFKYAHSLRETLIMISDCTFDFKTIMDQEYINPVLPGADSITNESFHAR